MGGLSPGGGRVGCPPGHSSSSQRVDRTGGHEGQGQRQGRDIDTDSLSIPSEGSSEEGQTRLGGERDDLQADREWAKAPSVVHLHHNCQGVHFNNAGYWVDLKAAQSEFLGVITFYTLPE